MTRFARMLPVALVLGALSVLQLGGTDLRRHAALSILGTVVSVVWVSAGVAGTGPRAGSARS